MASDRRLRVTVVAVAPDLAKVVDLQVPAGTCLGEVLAQSGLLPPDAALGADIRVGVFGAELPLDTLVRDGDRVEIYRALQINPKEARRRRAASRRR